MAAPGQLEVTAWMSRTGMGAADAADHFWPGLDPEARAKVAAKFRVWKQRSNADAQPAQRAPNVPSGDDEAQHPTRIVVEDRHHAPARMDRVPFLEWQLAQLVASYEAVLAQGNVGRIAQIDARISEVRQHLDGARSAARPITLDRSPAAVTEEIERRQKLINQLADASRRSKERDL